MNRCQQECRIDTKGIPRRQVPFFEQTGRATCWNLLKQTVSIQQLVPKGIAKRALCAHGCLRGCQHAWHTDGGLMFLVRIQLIQWLKMRPHRGKGHLQKLPTEKSSIVKHVARVCLTAGAMLETLSDAPVTIHAIVIRPRSVCWGCGCKAHFEDIGNQLPAVLGLDKSLAHNTLVVVVKRVALRWKPLEFQNKIVSCRNVDVAPDVHQIAIPSVNRQSCHLVGSSLHRSKVILVLAPLMLRPGAYSKWNHARADELQNIYALAFPLP